MVGGGGGATSQLTSEKTPQRQCVVDFGLLKFFATDHWWMRLDGFFTTNPTISGLQSPDLAARDLAAWGAGRSGQPQDVVPGHSIVALVV